MNNMVSNSRQRIVELMNYYNINQTEFCRRTGILKSSLSNYLNGDREPRLSQILLIIDAFDINPAWIMGYDVPMKYPACQDNISYDNSIIEKALDLYTMIDDLPQEKKVSLINYLRFLKSDI